MKCEKCHKEMIMEAVTQDWYCDDCEAVEEWGKIFGKRYMEER